MLDLREPDRAVLADLGRTTIRLWEWGDPDGPAVVLVHGGWDHGRMWDGFAPLLADAGYHAVALDVRGHGDSGRLHASGTYWLMFLLDLAQVATRYGAAAAPIRFIGHSFGGGLTLSFAAAFPELIRQVVNIDGLGPPPEMMIVQDHATVAAYWLHDAVRTAEGPREYASVEEMAEKRKAINTRLPMDWCRHLAAHGTKPGPQGGWIWKSDPAFRLGSPGPFDETFLLAQYRAMRCPVLALTGSEPDQWSELPEAARRRRLAAMTDAAHHIIEGAGHYVHVEQPDAVLDHVRRFFAR